MAVQQLIQKPKDVTYTQMSIWLDAHFYDEDCDLEKAYIYLWCLSYMVACKRRYFNSYYDYEGFASFMAYDVFKRRHKGELSKLKSSLNYIKSVASFRRIQYEKERHQELFNEYVNWDNDKYLDSCRYTLEKTNHAKTESLMEDLLQQAPEIIKCNVPSMFKQDKALFQNIYTSCMLSFLNQVTLNKKQQEYYETKSEETLKFEEAKYLNKNLEGGLILWHLPEEYTTAVQVTLNKTKNYMLKEIHEIIAECQLTNEEFDDIMNGAYGDNNDLCDN